ncbi:hypothetical protein QAD02_005528 [Eretmocerus hayati]|uniref:Uncharacterized protein n=1 Tax=Eretmocerus hayati TaxID=131215 RepID=A0ACC2NTU7_9HYME|nr:hypothetical protein QAD02_005528 [Eretmocerus hayati]
MEALSSTTEATIQSHHTEAIVENLKIPIGVIVPGLHHRVSGMTAHSEVGTKTNLTSDEASVALTEVLGALSMFLLSMIALGCNSVILAAFYRYKRLRTASNCLLVSLAISDFGVGVLTPLGMYLELSPDLRPPSTTSSSSLRDHQQAILNSETQLDLGIIEGWRLCMLPYCAILALSSVSVLVTVAIALDRLTSLAQPLRYKNIITHSSIERYIALFWIYAIAVGLSPLAYAQHKPQPTSSSQSSEFGDGGDANEVPGATFDRFSSSGSCRFNGVISPPVRFFLFLAVWAPSALILLACYIYVFLVARAHARAIYTVELSFRNQTQTIALPRYGQTLAVTVGAFFILWLPFQTCMLVDTFCGTNILADCTLWLGLPILAHSASNPWIYAYHHGDIRFATLKITNDLMGIFGLAPSKYGCSVITRRGSGFDLGDAYNNHDNSAYDRERRPPVEDCFAAEKRNCGHQGRRLYSETSSKNNVTVDISPENNTHSAECTSPGHNHKIQLNVVEESIHDLTRMLDPDYIVDRNHVIDSNHNIDKIRNLKYLLDPTFNKIRHLQRIKSKRSADAKNCAGSDGLHESCFVSYQNLKTKRVNGCARSLNAMSDPTLSSVRNTIVHVKNGAEVECQRLQSDPYGGKTTSLASFGEPGIVRSNFKHIRPNNLFSNLDSPQTSGELSKNLIRGQQHLRSFSWARARHRYNDSPSTVSNPNSVYLCSHSSLPTPDRSTARSSYTSYHKLRGQCDMRQPNIYPNHLASLLCNTERSIDSSDSDSVASHSLYQNQPPFSFLTHSGSMSEAFGNARSQGRMRLLEPSRLMDSLTVPTIHSEPPSPIDPLPLGSLHEAGSSRSSLVELTGEKQFSPSRSMDLIGPVVHQEEEDYCCLGDRLVVFPEHDSARLNSRRPSDCSRWSEASRSQEILPSSSEQPVSLLLLPSSRSVNNFPRTRDGNELLGFNEEELGSSCLGRFACSSALSSSLRESLFGADSMPDSSDDTFTSLDGLPFVRERVEDQSTCPKMGCLRGSSGSVEDQWNCENHDKSVRPVFHDACSEKIIGLEDNFGTDDCRRGIAPLAVVTPTELCSPELEVGVLLMNDADAVGHLVTRV